MYKWEKITIEDMQKKCKLDGLDFVKGTNPKGGEPKTVPNSDKYWEYLS